MELSGEGVASEAEREALAEGVYRRLLRAIVAGDPAPGTRLKERELSERYAVSRVPVRQAIQRLEAEGFVMTEPHRGAVVRGMTTDDIHELFDARLCVEPFATRIAAERLGTGVGDPTRLAEILEGSREAFAAGDEPEGISMNLAFHAEIVRLSGNRTLVQWLRPMLGRMEWIFRLTHEAREEDQILEHQQLYDALVTGKGELAAAQAYSHIELGRDPILRSLAPYLD